MKVASRNIILPLSTKSFQKSFQGFALLPSIFLKRNIFSIIPSRLYVTTFELIRLNLSFSFPHFLYFSVYLYNGETLLTPYVCIYLYHPVSLRNTFVTSSCTASKSLPRTKCYSLIEIFPSRHPSLAKLTPCCRAPPKQIFTRSRARRRASYVREEGGAGRVRVYYVTFDRPRCRRAPTRRGHFEKYIRSPLLFRKLGHLPWQPAKLLIDRPPTSIG